jgi:hypothetical protein
MASNAKKVSTEPASVIPAVPELTRSADIKLNERVSLRRHPRALSLLHRTISPIRTHTKAKSSGDHITPAALFAFQNMSDFELRSPKPNLADDPSLSSGREGPVRNKAMPDGVSGSMDIEKKSPTEPTTGLRRALMAMAMGMACCDWRRYPRMADRDRLGRRRARSMACWLEHKSEKLSRFHHRATDHAP